MNIQNVDSKVRIDGSDSAYLSFYIVQDFTYLNSTIAVVEAEEFAYIGVLSAMGGLWSTV